ncbi:DUF3048 domain-containing protein [Actinospongicola halichondriae]|uniref:DUF3048 domain-containing protein n=1 Tax=Actinospongicola halichondriae TaxID=3236844 RepID=UPI003D5C9DD9
MSKKQQAIAGGIGAVILLIVGFLVFGGGGDDEPIVAATTTTTEETTTTTTEPPRTTSALTGLPVEQEVLDAPVVAVKIDNVDGKSTPQVGITAADVVYEIQVEGSVTRLLSLFQSTDAAPIGPVRSARGSEIGVLEELNNPLFTWHGENGILGPMVRAAKVQARSINEISGLFYREGGRPAPYNSFVQGSAQIRETADEGSTGPVEPIFTFAAEGESPSPLATPASSVHVQFSGGAGGAPVDYAWDGTVWKRSQKGHPHVDADGNQVAVENVIVRFVQGIDSGTRDKAGSVVPTAQVIGEGEVWVLSQGTVTKGTWKKADGVSVTQYLDADGNPIKLTPGKTWISMPYTAAGSSVG